MGKKLVIHYDGADWKSYNGTRVRVSECIPVPNPQRASEQARETDILIFKLGA